MINVVGLGPGAKESLTLGALELLKKSKHVYLRTKNHPTVEFLDSIGIRYETYDYKYEKSLNFDDVYQFIAKDIIKKYKEFKDIVYAVPGHPLVAEKSVSILNKLCKEQNIPINIVPSVSFVDSVAECLNIDLVKGLKIINAFDIKNQILDKRIGTLITQVYDRFIASNVKIYLSNYYKDTTQIYFIKAAGVKEIQSVRKIALYELDRQKDIDHLTSVYVPSDMDNTKDFYDLLNIMEILRSKNGCPWDREQTHETLKKSLIEECYEVIEAINEKDNDELVEELGDVLFQVVFHSQIGKEEGMFNINDVIVGICNKMINRHPHVFGDVSAKNSKEVLDNWDKIKKSEQKLNTYTDSLRHVPKELPALMRAFKVQEKASRAGFDCRDVELLFEKVKKQFYNVKNVYKFKNKVRITEELGNLIFDIVNIARILDIDPEYALNYTIGKFIKRFEYMENELQKRGLELDEISFKQMIELWNKAKNIN